MIRLDGGAAASNRESGPSKAATEAARTMRSTEKSGRKTCVCEVVFLPINFFGLAQLHVRTQAGLYFRTA